METIMEVTQMIKSNDYLVSINLSDAFLHIVYQYCTTAFGLASSTFVFTKVCRPILEHLRSQGIRISAYLDDWILIAHSNKPNSKFDSSLLVTGSGLDHKREEVSTSSNSTIRTSRLFIEYPGYESSPTTTKTSRHHQPVDQASTSGYICNIPSSTLHQTPAVLQEPSSQTRQGSGSTDSFGSGEHRGASMVLRESTEMKRKLYTSIDSQSDHICGRLKYRMRMQLETLRSTRVLDTSRSLTIDRLLARTQSGSSSIEDFSTFRELEDSDSDRQHNQLILHQQAGWHSIPATSRISNRSLELVPRPQNNNSGTTHQGINNTIADLESRQTFFKNQ
ncbi:hypothetical protein [Parasitella parasitica]|uniref:Reverse transcriptase domain-containing protein n=1 Tax=Parasitella parasitica TaxID=35722 RepID=A0A0B7MZE5_9FUNG|nr:hypothetical protein [Parasitella parasitica]